MAKDSLIKEKIKLNVINKQINLIIDDDFINLNIEQIYKRIGLNNIGELKNQLKSQNSPQLMSWPNRWTLLSRM